MMTAQQKLESAGYPYLMQYASKPMTRQQHKEAQARYRQEDTYRPNVFPRGRSAAKMLWLGWEFKENKSAETE